MKKVKMFFVCLFACLSVFAQKSETVVSDVTTSQGTSPEYIEPFDSIQAAKIIRQLIHLLNELDECTDAEGRKIKDSEKQILHDVRTNTKSNWVWDDFNLYGILAILLSVAAYNFQKKTADHTKNAPVKVQLGILADLPRHFYRNLVCTFGIINRYKNNDNFSHQGKPIGYPSESNFMKLMTRPEDVLLKIDVQENTYKKMHESNLLFRNYCIEIKVASEHITRSDISQSSLRMILII